MSVQFSSPVAACDLPSPVEGSSFFSRPNTPQGTEGCPVAHLRSRLKGASLRPTRQRMLLGWLLFGKGDRHVTAEQLFHEVNRARATLSLATVYNTLNQFRDSGLLRTVASVGDRAVYDTNTGDHHHFVVEQTGMIFDFPEDAVVAPFVPAPPSGYRVLGVDVVVRLEKIDRVATPPHEAIA